MTSRQHSVDNVLRSMFTQKTLRACVGLIAKWYSPMIFGFSVCAKFKTSVQCPLVNMGLTQLKITGWKFKVIKGSLASLIRR